MQPVAMPEKLRESLKLTNETGLMILSVEPGGPAEKAGVLIGDILVALDGKPLADTEELAAHLTAGHIGKSVKASLVRGGAPESTWILPSRNAPPATAGKNFPRWLEARPLASRPLARLLLQPRTNQIERPETISGHEATSI